MVYYLQQNVALLDQISRQIFSVAPQIPIPSTPPPFPSFKPSETDVRVNVFWFMALIFSLAAALLAILVQQWVRDYMHVFQRYGDPLKCARVRQYLHDGLEGWYMPVVAEAVPGFLHVSLFLFFLGLCDFVLNINTTVGVTTTVPIAITGFLYIFATFIPIVRPQSPYQTSFSTIFSVIIWYPKQKWGGTQHQDSGSDGAKKPVRWNTTQGRMQLAMKETEERKGRDENAIRWLIDNMTEDAEMESLVMAIPGSFNGKWAMEVWENVSNPLADGPHTGPMALLPRPDPPNVRPYSDTAHNQEEHTMHGLNTRVAHLLETCKNRGRFASEELWRKRTRGCVETTVSLVRCASTELVQFGDIVQLLGDIGVDQKVRELSSEGKDQMFVMRWTCLSLVAIQPVLASDRKLHNHASWVISSLTEDQDHTSEKQTHTRTIETFHNALEGLSGALNLAGNVKEAEAREILRNNESLISTLGGIGDQYDDSADWWIQAIQREVVRTTHRIICQLPGIKFDDPDKESVHLSQPKESYRDRHKFQFISPSHRFKRISEVAHTFQNILEGQWNNVTFKEGIKDLQEMLSLVRDDPLRREREVWRLQDLHEGGGLGFTVELFFLALRQLLSTSSSEESHSALLTGTFEAITSDWRKYKNSLGTQKLLLDWVVSDNGIIFNDTDTYPGPIVDAFLRLLANVLEGQGGSHIDDIVQELAEKSHSPWVIPTRRAFYSKVLGYISPAGAQGPSSWFT